MASCNWKKYHGGTAAKGIMRHSTKDTRLEDEHTNKDLRKELTHLNMDFGAMGSYAAACKAYDQRLAELDAMPGANKRKDRVTLVGLCIPAPDGMDADTARKWFVDAYQIVCDELGEKNVIGGSVHFDEVHDYRNTETKQMVESRFHLQAYGVPEKNGKLNAKAVTSRSAMIRMNNRIHAMTAERYPGYRFMDGSKKKSRKSVEELKQESDKLDVRIRAEEAAKQMEAVARAKEKALDERENRLEDREAHLRVREATLRKNMDNFPIKQAKWQEAANTALEKVLAEYRQKEPDAELLKWLHTFTIKDKDGKLKLMDEAWAAEQQRREQEAKASIRQKRSKGAVDLMDELGLSETMNALGGDYFIRRGQSDMDFEL